MKKQVIVALFSFMSFSCGVSNILNTSGNYDYGADGNLLDTSKNRKLITDGFDAAIRMEESGKYPETDWLDGWRRTIKSNKSRNTSDSVFYINYIIEERRKKGLSEL